jgi:hypothetical protein
MGGKCFKEINVANSIQFSKEHEQQPGGVNTIYVQAKPKEIVPTTKKSNKTTSSTSLGNVGGTVSQRKTKSIFNALHNLKIDNQHNESQEGENFKILKEKNKDLDDLDLINNCLAKHFFMKSLEKSARMDIIKEMSLVQLPENTVIFQQGDIGKYFYILHTGEVNLNANIQNTKIIRAGESFGELALLHQAPRSGTCMTLKECTFWILERKLFRKIIEHINKMNFEENKKFIQSIAILDLIEKDQKAILISNLLKEAYDEGDYIVKGKF